MKTLLPIVCALFVAGLVSARAEPVLKPNDVLAIAGDSITQQKIYTVFMEDYLLMCAPVDGLRVVQFGWGSERAFLFQVRIASDILPFKPTVVTTCYGMNDGNYRPMDELSERDYRKNMQTAIDKFKAAGVRQMIIGSAGCVDTKTFKRVSPDVYNKTLEALGGFSKELAEKNGFLTADLHSVMMDVMAKAQAAYGSGYVFIGGDGIHPGFSGHLVMAYAFLKALGCDGAIGTVTVDMAAGQATGTPGQKIVSFKDGAVTLESTRYPFCFQGNPNKGDGSTASVLQFFPFNDDLNRYILVVKGLKGSKAKITWGQQSKEFTTTDLEKGINLAAEFLANPFADQFKKVDAAVQAQQALETTLVQKLLHNIPDLKTLAPADAPALDKLAADGMQQDKVLFNTAQSLVVPVQHTIRIEPVP